MKIGDKFIYFTKYGGKVIGEIADFRYNSMNDTSRKVRYSKIEIITTNGVCYPLEECFRFEKELSEEDCKNIDSFFCTLNKICLEKEKKKIELEKYLI